MTFLRIQVVLIINIFIDIEIKHNCNPVTIDSIRKMCTTHEQNKLETPLTQAAIIAPLQDFTFRPWSKDGFTFTSWIRLNSNTSTSNSSGIDTTFEDDCFYDPGSQQCVCKNNLHFLTIGTSSLMLSAYLCMSNVSTIFFQLSNPIVQAHRGLSKSHSEHFRCPENVLLNGTRRVKCVCSALKKRRSSSKKDLIHTQDAQHTNEQRNQRKSTRSKERRQNRMNNVDENLSSSPNALSSTMRMALKSSLSHFNIFSSNRNNEKENEAINFGIPAFIKGLKISRSRWTLFSISAVFTKTELKIKVSIDNISVGTIDLPCSLSQLDAKREKFTIMGLGHRFPPHITLKNQTKQDTIDFNLIKFKYSLSNVLLFKSNEINSEMLANLYAMGPDCVNFAQCQIGNLLPNLGIPAINKTHTTMHVNEVLKSFRERILLVYSAHRPNMIIGYHNIDGYYYNFN